MNAYGETKFSEHERLRNDDQKSVLCVERDRTRSGEGVIICIDAFWGTGKMFLYNQFHIAICPKII